MLLQGGEYLVHNLCKQQLINRIIHEEAVRRDNRNLLVSSLVLMVVLMFDESD